MSSGELWLTQRPDEGFSIVNQKRLMDGPVFTFSIDPENPCMLAIVYDATVVFEIKHLGFSGGFHELSVIL